MNINSIKFVFNFVSVAVMKNILATCGVLDDVRGVAT